MPCSGARRGPFKERFLGGEGGARYRKSRAARARTRSALTVSSQLGAGPGAVGCARTLAASRGRGPCTRLPVALKLRRPLQATGPHLRPRPSVSHRTLRSGSAQPPARADPASPAVPGSGRRPPRAWLGLGGVPGWEEVGGPTYPSHSRSISTNGFLSRRQAA